MHPMIMLTSCAEGVVYANGAYLGEIRKDAPLFRPVSPCGAVSLEFHPFQPMALSSNARIVFSGGKPLSESIHRESGLTVIAWPFGITEIDLSINIIHTSAPLVKTLTCAQRTFRFIKTPVSAYIECEFQGRVSMHPLPDNANEPVFAEGEGVLYVSGNTQENQRYALVLTQSGEHVLLSVSGKEVTFLPEGKVRVLKSAGDLAGHESEEIFIRQDVRFDSQGVRYLKNPDADFRAVTPCECALCLAESVAYGFEDESDLCLSGALTLDGRTMEIIKNASSIRPMRFTPPDGRHAIAALTRISPALYEAVPLYYRAEMTDGVWKIIDMKAW